MQREQAWPTPGSVAVVDEGPKDGLGRQQFTLLWWQDGRKRAQVFFAVKSDILSGRIPEAVEEVSA